MSILTQALKAVVGETWQLPVSVAGLVVAAVALKAAAPGLWSDAGGPLLLAGAVGILALVTRRP